MTTYFISDLHLSREDTDNSKLFFQFIDKYAVYAKQVFILGDLFDKWVGDDYIDPFIQKVKFSLSSLALHGVKLFIQTGNRDFLLGDKFCKDVNATLISDPYVIDNILLMHGDLLCTKDISYQVFRKIVRNPIIDFIYLKLPLRFRISIAEKLRNISIKNNKSRDYTDSKYDVVLSSVIEYLDKYQCAKLIHGHTHKPKVQEIPLSFGHGSLYVLGDWSNSAVILKHNNSAVQPINLSLDPIFK